jgi:hypothetical protein
MAEILINAGTTLPLCLQLGSGLTTKYVRARLYTVAGVQIGSDISLVHTSGGLYVDNSVLKNTDDFTLAIYKVFDDALFTTPSKDDQDAIDVFIKNQAASQVQSGGELLRGIVKNSTLLGIVNQDDNLKGLIETSEVKGLVTSKDIIGLIESNELKGIIYDNC